MFCHYFNNNKSCPYNEIGCKFIHRKSKYCINKDKCQQKLCCYQHPKNNFTENSISDQENLSDKMEISLDDSIEENYEENENKLYNCDKCEFAHIVGTELQNHIITIHEQTEHKSLISCDYCKFETEKAQNLILHMKEIHELSCDQCNTKFVTNESLDLHKKFKHLLKTTPCVRCKCDLGTKAPSCIDCQENGCKSCVENLMPKSLLDSC